MTIRTSMLTLVVAALAWVAPAAQAHLLSGDEAVTGKVSVSAQSSLSVMQAAGIRYHAQANYANEKRLLGTSKSSHVAPDNRAGRRGI
jgi:hypothetical protein